MIEILTETDLETLLNELRRFGSDTQWVEAKASKSEMPRDLWKSVVGFANSDSGGLVLLGVDETSGFRVVGVDKASKVADDLGAVCANLQPPVRAVVHHVEHTDGIVVVGQIPPVQRTERPCFKPPNVATGAYRRVGDRDDLMTTAEIEELRSNTPGKDQSIRPAPDGAQFAQPLVAELVAAERTLFPDLDQGQVLAKLGATTPDGNPTLAGFLAVGEYPESRSAAARVAHKVMPVASDPEGTRFTNQGHFEGTVGQILDQASTWFVRNLSTAVVARPDGQLVDALEVPAEALREVLSNALVHGSLATGQEDVQSVVTIAPTHVTATNPGGLHAQVDPRTLGLGPMSTPRNLSLVRICTRLRTPAGSRITESHASGIAAADRECKAAGTAPPLFAVRPAQFTALLMRGPLPVDATTKDWAARGEALSPDEGRLLAFAGRLDELHAEDAVSDFHTVQLDTNLAARALTPMPPERAAVVLARLESIGALESMREPDRLIWRIPTEPAGPRGETVVPEEKTQQAPKKAAATADKIAQKKNEDLNAALTAVEGARDGMLGMKDIQAAIGKSKSTASRVVAYAVSKSWLEPTSDEVYDPTRKYHLTRSGKIYAAKLRSQ